MIGPLTSSSRMKRFAVATALFALSAGCAGVRNYEPSVAPDSLDGTSFLHYLGTVPVASVGEGCRAILLAADGTEAFDTHEERYAELIRRGLVRPAWGLQGDHVLDKGTLAFMAARVCRLPGGVNTHLLASWGLGDRRYALKDAAAAGLMSYDTPDRAVRGGELLSTLGKIDDYLAEGDLYDQGQSEAEPSADASGE